MSRSAGIVGTDGVDRAVARRLRPLTGGAVVLAAGRGGVAVAGSLATVAVARILGPAGAGGYAVAVAIVVVLTVLCTFGVEHGIAYYVSSRRWDARAAFRSAQLVALGAGLLGAAGCVGVRLLYPAAFDGLSAGLTALVALALPFTLSWYYAGYIALATEHFEGYALAPLTQALSALVLVVALSAVAGLRGALIGMTLAHVIAAAVMFVWTRRRLAGLPGVDADGPREAVPEIDADGSWVAVVDPGAAGTLRRAAGFGVKSYAANALGVLVFRLDLFILAAVAGPAAVGRYAVAVAVAQTLWQAPPVLSDLVFPRVAALTAGEGENPAAQRAMVEEKGIRHSVLIVVVTAVAVALGLVFLVVPVFGPGFSQSVGLGLILLPGVALFGLYGVFTAIVVGRGKPVYSLVSALIVTPATVVLYLLLIPSLKGTGAALASTLSYAGSFALAVYFFKRVTGTSLVRVFLPTRGEWDDYRRLLGTLRDAAPWR